MAPRSIEDIKTRTNEFADAFENYDPARGDQDAPLPPVMMVKLAAWRCDTAERELAEAVRAAREQRLSWREVGEAIGTTGEAARQRYANAWLTIGITTPPITLPGGGRPG